MQDYATIVGVVGMRLSGFSYDDVQRRHGVGSSTVTRIMRAYDGSGLTLEELKAMEPREVEGLFYPPEARRRKKVPLPDFEAVHARMVAMGKNADLAYIWTEYKRDNPEGYQLSQFYKLYGDWLRDSGLKSPASMPVERVPGQKMYIDWMGDRPKALFDPETGELSEAHVFVTTLGVSSKGYAEAFLDEKTPAFVAGTAHALAFYGALPDQLVPDNTKAAVSKHTRDGIVLSAAYRDLEEYYDVAVVPAPPHKPKGKPTAENAVRHLERLIANALAGKAFPTLAALNAEIAGIVERVNAAPFANPRDVRGSRDRAFDEIDLPQMRALPGDPFTTCDYRSFLRVPDNYHLEYDGHYYSVSHTMRGKPAVLKATMSEVRICDADNRLLCVHRRAWEKFPLYVTDDSHMPEAHRFAKEANERDGAYYRRWAAAIGPNTAQVIDRILRAPRHEQQAYRSCAGLLHACKGLPRAQVEEAAGAVVASKTFTYTQFKRMLSSMAKGGPKEGGKLPEHGNIRGKGAWL